jgi:phage baseplate assembly protein W
MTSTDFLGRGWDFPVRLDDSGGFALSGGEDDVEQAMHLILNTAIGERPMRPEYGCAIHDRFFDSFNAALAGRIAEDVRQSLNRWEPRVEVGVVDVETSPVDPNVLMVTVGYRIKATNDRRNLVFPFYSIPQE